MCKSILLVLFVSYYANITFFSHAHIINGVTIVHSHFHTGFDNSQHPQHQHSTADIQLIAVISQLNIESLPFQISVEDPLPQHVDKELVPLVANPYLVDFEGEYQLRAPPYC